MKKESLLITTVIILVVLIATEVAYLTFGKSLNSPQPAKVTIISPSTSEKTAGQKILKKPLPSVPLSEITYFPARLSTPIPNVQNTIDNATTKFYGIMYESAYVLKKSQLSQEYEGTITEISFLNQEMTIQGKKVVVKLKFAIQANTETPVLWYFSPETVQRISVIDTSNDSSNKIDLMTLKKGDRVKINAVFDILKDSSPPDSFIITKLN